MKLITTITSYLSLAAFVTTSVIPSQSWGQGVAVSSSTGAIHELPLHNNDGDEMQNAIESFNKVWIIPDKVEVYQNGDVAYIVKAKLKVMLEEDYVAAQQSNKLSSPNVM